MNLHALARTLALVALPPVAACTADPELARKVDRSFPTEPAAPPIPILCPITGEEVTVKSPQAWFNVYPVYCLTEADRKQFATLKPTARARAASEQVLPQKRITNATCPIAELTARAVGGSVVFVVRTDVCTALL